MPINKQVNKKGVKKKRISEAVKRNKEIPFLLTGAIVIIFLFIYISVNAYRQHQGVKSEEQQIAQQKASGSAITQGKENLMPETVKARLQLESINNTDVLKVIPEGSEKKDSAITYTYKWIKNDEPVGGNTDSISGFKKGDKIEVKITPFDGKKYGQPRTLSTEIMKTTPKIIENKEIIFDGNVLSHKVKAIDPDNGTLSYSLIEAPKDMTIDKTNGMINWQVKPDEFGVFNIRVKISNDQGGETVYQLNINLNKAEGEPKKDATILPQ
ncbi:MAG: hypothetical protein NTX36_09710 [Proteobacteria bacterium]|nr:hypothetical protein [Pseudomonadota bacterium]